MINLENKCWDLTAFLSGGLLTLSFSPFDFSYLALIALVLLFVSWHTIMPLRAALRGYLFGLGLFGSGVSWVYVSVHDFGGGGIVLSFFMTLLFVGFWAIFPAVSGYLSVRFFQTNSVPIKIITLPAVWIMVEFLRGKWVFNGFPWFQIAYSQLDTPLAGYIPLMGAYGTGLILAFTASVIALLITNRNRFSVFSLGVIVCLWIGGWALQNVSWTHSIGGPVKVTMIQGNISQDQKWQPEYKNMIMKRYKDMTYQHWDSQVIIWPESAVPAFYHQVSDDYLFPLEIEAKKNNTDLVISLPIKNEKGQKFNAVMTFGDKRGIYRKIHLLPFGEYFPLQPISGFVLDSLTILPVGSFTAGQSGQALLIGAGYPFITSICYEDAFGEESVRRLSEAAYLVNVTNDGWFGDSLEPYQHMQIARMRALEAGRYLLRSTNSGVTAVVSPDGKIIHQAPLFVATALTADIIPMKGVTPYARLGDNPINIMLCILLLGSYLYVRLLSDGNFDD